MPVLSLYQNYRKQSVNTMTPGELIVLLFEEAAMSINQAASCIKARKMGEAHNAIIRSQNIFLYLIDSLDFSYPISRDLLNCYKYICDRLLEANLHKDNAILLELLTMTTELKGAWQGAEASGRAASVAAGGGRT